MLREKYWEFQYTHVDRIKTFTSFVGRDKSQSIREEFWEKEEREREGGEDWSEGSALEAASQARLPNPI